MKGEFAFSFEEIFNFLICDFNPVLASLNSAHFCRVVGVLWGQSQHVLNMISN